jgi:hypothetical protein
MLIYSSHLVALSSIITQAQGQLYLFLP